MDSEGQTGRCPGWLKVMFILATLLFHSVYGAPCNRSYQIVMMPLGLAMMDDGQGKLSGFVPDIYREMAQRSGCTLDVVSQPPARMMAFKPFNPLIAPLFIGPTPKGQKLVYIPFMRDRMQVAIRKDRAEHFNLQQFLAQGGVIGILRGANYGQWGTPFLAALAPERKMEINTLDSVYRMLDADRVQLTFANTYVFYYLRQSMQHADSFTLVPVPEEPEAVYYMRFNLDVLDADDAERLMRTFETMRDEGRICAIMARYFDPSNTHMMCTGLERGKRTFVE